ncbi:unnamed protein product [Penicillium salamii]|nr:unnamed protein product [Penicillium salamii]CAG8402391.1 unnamed protein product [Penicillium salamii]
MASLYLILPFALCIISVASRWLKSPLSTIPGPAISKFSGIVLKYHWLTGNRMKYVHSLHHQYGPVVRVSPEEVDVADIASVKEIHRIGTGFMKSSFYRNLTRHDIENLFNTSDPKFHGVRRRLLSAPISDIKLRESEPSINARVQLAIDKMQDSMDETGVVDVFQWWLFMATDIIGELCFGDSFRMLEYGKVGIPSSEYPCSTNTDGLKKNQYCRDLEAVSATEAVRVAFPHIVSLAEIVPLPYFHQAAQGGARMVQYASQSVQRYKNISAESTEPKTTLFTRLFDSEKDGLSDKDITDEAISFIIAGSDTTANTLTYLVWSVCQDESIRSHLLEELSSIPDIFQDEHLRPLPYLTQVIDETLRLYSGVPSGLPRVSRHGAHLAGHWIPAGTTVTTQAYTLHRDPSAFDEPERFNPSRWEKPTRAMKDAVLSFGGGARTCLGVHLARMELRLATALFFRAFPKATIDPSMDASDMDQVAYFLLSPRGKRCLINVS